MAGQCGAFQKINRSSSRKRRAGGVGSNSSSFADSGPLQTTNNCIPTIAFVMTAFQRLSREQTRVPASTAAGTTRKLTRRSQGWNEIYPASGPYLRRLLQSKRNNQRSSNCPTEQPQDTRHHPRAAQTSADWHSKELVAKKGALCVAGVERGTRETLDRPAHAQSGRRFGSPRADRSRGRGGVRTCPRRSACS